MQSYRRNRTIVLLSCSMLFVLFLSVIACATRNMQYASTDMLVQEQNFSAARQEIEANKSSLYTGEDTILYYLDDGMLAFYDGKNTESISQLSIADRLMEDAYTKSFSQETLSFILNDTVKEYAGEEHERIFTNVFLSLNYLLQNNFDNGFVEMRKALNVIQKIQNDNRILYDSYAQADDAYVSLDEYETPIIDSAFVRLLSSWVYRADRDISDYEVALRNYNNAVKLQPHLYTFSPPEYDTEQGDEIFSQYTQSANVQIVAFTGRIPIKVEKGFSVNAAEGIAVIHAFDEETILDGYTVAQSNDSSVLTTAIAIPDDITFSARFSLPYIVRYTSEVQEIEVYVDDAMVGTLQKTEDMAAITQAIFESKRNFIYAKTISRVIAKALISTAATQAASQANETAGLFASIAGGLFNNLSETADTRSARYYPGVIWTGDFLLSDIEEAKDHTITIQYINALGQVLYQEEKIATVDSTLNKLNLITSVFLH